MELIVDRIEIIARDITAEATFCTRFLPLSGTRGLEPFPGAISIHTGFSRNPAFSSIETLSALVACVAF